MKKPKKLSIGKLQDKLWQECRRIIRDIYKRADGTYNCYTCSQTNLQSSNLQTGHFIQKSVCGAYLKYDLRNLRIQCMRCNCNLSGNGAIFYRNLVQDMGQEYVDQLFKEKNTITVKAYDHYEKQLADYKDM